MAQHKFTFLDKQRKTVCGFFYVEGKRKKLKLMSFDEAGRDDQGDYISKQVKVKKKYDALIASKYQEIKTELILEKERRSKPILIKAAFDRWIQMSEGQRSKETITKFYQPTVKRYLQACGDHLLPDFKLEKLDIFIKSLGDISGNTKNIQLRTLRTFANWAYDRELIEKVPKFPMVKAYDKLPEVYTDEELRALLERVRTLSEENRDIRQRRYYKAHERFIIMAIATGLRLSELLFLEWSQVDHEDGFITVRSNEYFEVKEGRDKIRLIMPFALPFITQEKANSSEEVYFLDNGQGEPLYKTPHAMSTALLRHQKALGLNPKVKSAHGFRALFASLAEESGVDPVTIQDLLNHSSMEVTRHYLGRPSARMQSASIQLNDRISKIGL